MAGADHAGSYVDGLNARKITQMARDDFLAAKLARQDLEDRKLEAYRTYRSFRTDIADGGKKEETPGPFGWSKMTIPIGFWTTETATPRYVSKPPRPVVKPRNAAAVPYLAAKSLRLERQWERADPLPALISGAKEMSIFGDGPLKVTWEPAERRAKVTSISWWYFWLSAEATHYTTSECLFHVTWHTKRQLQRLARLKDADGAQLFVNLDTFWDTATGRDVEDRHWQERREAAGLGALQFEHRADSIPLLECWYDDGSRVILGGASFETLVHARPSPYATYDGKAIRPFVVLQNTIDPGMPYSIGDLEVVRDYQVELSTLRNQNVDQMTAAINAPIAYDERIGGAIVRRAFSAPGALIPTQGDPTRSIHRLAPGIVNQDVAALTQMVFGEVERATGLNEYAVGRADGGGLFNNTATGAQIAVGESNKRWDFKKKLVELGMAEVVRLVECHDRQFMLLDVIVPLAGRETPAEESEGMTLTDDKSLAIVSAAVNGWELLPGEKPGRVSEMPEYDIEVEESSAAPPTQRERAQNMVAFLGTMANSPQLAALVDWNQVAREVTLAFGFNADKMLVSIGAPAYGEETATGEVPVGPPQALTPEEEQAALAGGTSRLETGPDGQPLMPGQAPEPAPAQEAPGPDLAELLPALLAQRGVGGQPIEVNVNVEPGAVVINAVPPAEIPPFEVPPPQVTVNLGGGTKTVLRDDAGRPVGVDEEVVVDGPEGPETLSRRQDVVYDDAGQITGLTPAAEESLEMPEEDLNG